MLAAHGSVAEVATVVLLLVVALAVGLAARRLRFPYTLALVIVGFALGFFHVLPDLMLNPDLVLFLFLPALLFEGAWNLNTEALLADWLIIFVLAVPGLAISLAIIALILHLGAGLPVLIAVLVGTIVSPTDPVAVLGLLKQLGMPARLRTIIDGESLFNDGVGSAAYVLGLAILLMSIGRPSELLGLAGYMIILKGIWLFVGGPVLGIAIGLVVVTAMRRVDDHLIETTVTFSVAYGSYVIGTLLGTSGLLCVVGAGLVLGNYGRRTAMSKRTRYAVSDIWEFTAYVANSLLFLLVGDQIGATDFAGALGYVVWAVVAVILGRAVLAFILVPLHNLFVLAAERVLSRGNREHGQLAPVPFLWRPLILLSGLRGALSLALVLSLPEGIPDRQILIVTVFGVVLVTLVGQGVGLRIILPRWPAAKPQTQ